MSEPPSPTQVYRQVQANQAQEHVQRIQELEERVRHLEGELAAARAGGGSEELAGLPGRALERLLGVFDAVPIPDLSAWEQRQAVARLEGVLSEVDVAAGAWISGEPPRVEVAEGDGVSIARLTASVVQVLSEVAGRYLAQMVEFQGTTPDAVVRARGSHLMDVSSVVDAKAQFNLLPPGHRRDLFEEQVDQLLVAKDQLATLDAWTQEARAEVARLLKARGLKTPRQASLLGLLRQLAESHDNDPLASRAALRALAADYARLLPEAGTLETLGLTSTTFQRAHASALGEADAPLELGFLAEALVALLDDHDALAGELRASALDKRERQALKPLAETDPGTARAALEALPRAAVEEARARREATHKALVKRSQRALEQEARARFATTPDPQGMAAAFERLSKPKRTAHLADLWRVLVQSARAALAELPELLAAKRAAVARALGGENPATLAARRAELERLAEALRAPDDATALALSTPIDVEAGLLRRQSEDHAARTKEFLAVYSAARKAGVRTLEEATSTLRKIDALTSGKKAALDRILKKGARGKRSPKREAAQAAALREEELEIVAGGERLAAHKAATFADCRARLSAAGLRVGDYDAAWSALCDAMGHVEVALAADEALLAAEGRLRAAAGVLEPRALTDVGAARAFLARVDPDERALDGAEQTLSAARDAYLERARALLRRAPADYDAARELLDEIRGELSTLDALREAATRYQAGWSAWQPELNTLAAVRARARRERKKALALSERVAAATAEIEKALARLTR